MANEAEESGFLSRWSRRKTLQRQGVAPGEPAGSSAPGPATTASAALQPAPVAKANLEPAALSPEPAPSEPAPTLADVAALGRDANYARFVGRQVQPEVRNAALAKLFTDPHFNVMDRLDVYIDDYGLPDPLPPGMLRQMAQARSLGLFDTEEAEPQPALAQTPPLAPTDAVAPPPPEPASDEDTDLQLQPDDDAGRAGPQAGAGEHAGQPH